MLRAIAGAFLLLACLPVARARAELVLDGAGWQVAPQAQSQKPVYHDVEQWLFPPSPQVKARPRISLKLVNRGDSARTAVLLRYAFSARLRKIGSDTAGAWTPPFLLEEKRIPQINAKSSRDVPLYMNRVALTSYLGRMQRAGFWPDAFRVQVMLEPRSGETLENRVLEAVLPLLWSTAASPAK